MATTPGKIDLTAAEMTGIKVSDPWVNKKSDADFEAVWTGADRLEHRYGSFPTKDDAITYLRSLPG